MLSTLANPTNLAANLSTTQINRALLSWQDNSTNETGFTVERKTGDSSSVNPYAVVGTLGANVTAYVDSTLSDTTTYTFRVKGYNSFLQSEYTNVASVTTVLSTLNAPTLLSARLFGADSQYVQLHWVDNSTNELGFIIERKSGDSTSLAPFLILDSVLSNTTLYIDSTVMLDSTYQYRVYAFNSYLISGLSNVADIRVPVELISFIADVTDGNVLLKWETASEINNAGFSIQRGKENNKFIDLAFVKGKGSTTAQTNYTYLDKSVLYGKYFYRLKQVDFDGSITYSKIIDVDLGLPKEYSLEQNYPNPFNPSTTIRFALPVTSNVSIKLYNALGQEVTNILNATLEAGVHETIFNAVRLSSGVYFYMINARGFNGSTFTSTKRMILIK